MQARQKMSIIKHCKFCNDNKNPTEPHLVPEHELAEGVGGSAVNLQHSCSCHQLKHWRLLMGRGDDDMAISCR